MKRLPLIPTLVVGLAVALMIALGLWQLLDRLPKKEAYIARLASNPAKPVIAFPRVPDDSLLFRRTRGLCLEPVKLDKAGAGNAGYRIIAHCRAGAEGPGIRVQLGTTRDPKAKIAWTGGVVTGWVSHAPYGRSLISGLFDKRPQEMLLVADTPVAGLAANRQPDVSLITNNHLAYAGQWFFFAAIAAIIYTLAARRRLRPQDPGRG